jgi:hypothetical protein
MPEPDLVIPSGSKGMAEGGFDSFPDGMVITKDLTCKVKRFISMNSYDPAS